MTHISQAQYVGEMRRLEAMRNEARRRQDRFALSFLALREHDINRVFWGRDPKGQH